MFSFLTNIFSLTLTNRELGSVGVGGVKSQAGYYYMADFEVVREGLKKRGITTSEQMSQAILEEADVAVRTLKRESCTSLASLTFNYVCLCHVSR